MKKVCFVVAAEITVKAFLLDHIRAMEPYFAVSVVANSGDADFMKPFGITVPMISVGIERKISPFADLKALLALYWLFRREKFDVVHSVTPKAGLLSMIAARFAGTPVRIHIFTGQVWATKRGFARWLLKFMDKILATCATHILVDSPSQRNFLIGQGVVSPEKSGVIAEGSICGVDAERFTPNAQARERIRRRCGISESDTVFLYLGRLNRDKGLLDLAHAFLQVWSTRKDARLIVVGPDEEGMKGRIESICTPCLENIHIEDYTDVPEDFIAASDVFCLPSYREGFGVVVIQAAAAGIPSIGTRIYGVIDTIEEGVTGFLYYPGDVKGLASKMIEMMERPDLRKTMGENARLSACERFSGGRVTKALCDYYKSLLHINN